MRSTFYSGCSKGTQRRKHEIVGQGSKRGFLNRKDLMKMKVKLTRITRPDPGKTLGFKSEAFFTFVELSMKNLHRLINMVPRQMDLVCLNEEEDCVWNIRNPLLFQNIV